MLNNDNTNINDVAMGSEEEVYEEAGDIVFEAALLRYLPGLSELDTSEFETYIEANVEKESFMEDLYKAYPEFGLIFDEEMNNLKTEFEAVLAATAKV